MNLYLTPEFAGEDTGDGGVRRVVEAQIKHLTKLSIKLVDDAGDADVIACHIDVDESLVRRHPDKPIVAHCHGLYWSEYDWQAWSYKANEKVLRAIQVADIVTAPTEWVAQIIRRHTSRDVRVVPHGISVRDWKQVVNHKDYVLWNKTRVDPVCDVDSLNTLVRTMPDIEFMSTFGDEAPNMTLTGKLDFAKAKDALRYAGVYLCTSRETFGIGTLEAMAAGVPVVAYRFGGQEEIIQHKVTGWLADPGDVEGLANGIRWSLENRAKVASAARAKVAEYSWTTAAKMYHHIYQDAIDLYVETGDPKVSIIVPAYNLAKYLPDALRSVQAQTDPDWECIIVDDDSPDSCGDIADSFAEMDDRFKVIHNETNQYLAESRNIAIREARGKYILPLDADDRLTPNAVQLLADELDSDRSIDVAYGRVYWVGEDGETPLDYGGPAKGYSKWPVPFNPDQQASGMNLLPYSSMYRRRAWTLTGGYRRRLKTSEDADFWTRLASYGFTMKYIGAQDTLVYRVRADSMSQTHREQWKAYIRWFPWAADKSLAPAALGGARGVSLLEPKVSVVIPVGPGHTKLVQDAVDSVVAQSYKLWEIIVVNDTGEPLPELQPFVRIVKSDARHPAETRNKGVAAARGQLYLPLDADDYLLPDALQWMVTAHVESGGEIIYPDFFEDPEQEGKYKPYSLDDFECNKLINYGSIHAVTALTPVSVWREVGGYRKGLGWEDWDFQLLCAEKGFCSRRIAAPLFVYRKWTGARRNYDKAEFQRRKAEIVKAWPQYFEPEGERKKMACGCSGRTVRPEAAKLSSTSSKEAGTNAIQIEYVGNKAANVRYRGASGAIYSFAAGDPPKWVLQQDAKVFLNRPDFRQTQQDSKELVLV